MQFYPHNGRVTEEQRKSNGSFTQSCNACRVKPNSKRVKVALHDSCNGALPVQDQRPKTPKLPGARNLAKTEAERKLTVA